MKQFKWVLALGLPTVLLVACQKQVLEDSVDGPNRAETLSRAAMTGNGGPSGAHYNLNIIGVSKEKSVDNDNSNGRRIFVSLSGKTKIKLSEGDFDVLDYNGTDGEAAFQLPDPSDGSDPVTGTSYSVWVRALGKPGGSATVTTCAESFTDPSTGIAYDQVVCSLESLYVERTTGRSKFRDVSRYLLTIYADITDDGVINPKRYNIFDDALEGYYWDYDNNGLKLLQVRFYPIASTLP